METLEQRGGRRAFLKKSAVVGAGAWTAPLMLKHVGAAQAVSAVCGGAANDAGVFTIPAGATTTLSDPTLNACNELIWGYELDATAVMGGSKAPGCFATTGPPIVIPAAGSDRTLRIFLSDVSCGRTYNSDETPTDHANVTGTGPWTVDLADAGGGCGQADTPREPADSGGNLRVVVHIDCV